MLPAVFPVALKRHDTETLKIYVVVNPGVSSFGRCYTRNLRRKCRGSLGCKKSSGMRDIQCWKISRILQKNRMRFIVQNFQKREVLCNAFSLFSTWRIFFWREQETSECDWVATSSVFVASQSSCFFSLFARTNSPSGKPALCLHASGGIVLI